MKIGILSDTHDNIKLMNEAIKVFNEREVDLVVHCGDWVAPFMLVCLQRLNCPVKTVFGNNDGDKFRHAKVAKDLGLDIDIEERFLEFDIDDKKACVFHGDYDRMVEALIKSNMWDIVIYGHNHTPKIETTGGVLSINPGAFVHLGKKAGQSFAIYDSESHSAEHIYFEEKC